MIHFYIINLSKLKYILLKFKIFYENNLKIFYENQKIFYEI